ncbi:MAG: hypothetical protein Q9225_004112 [Loekoesia sp. 1 TL-2023]
MDQRVNIERVPSKELAKTLKLNLLWEFTNDAFADAARQHPELGFAEGKRFEQPEDFIEEMGPNGITFIQYGPDSQQEPGGSARIIATAECKPWSGADKLDQRVKRMREEREAREKGMTNGQPSRGEGFYTKAHEEQLLQQLEKVESITHSDGQDDVPRWEVMTVCVRPDWQKQGLADRLLEMVTDEVRSQVEAQGKGPRFKLVVRALKEINEKYWLSKGFKPVGERFFEPGIFGSPTGFHILDLTRDHQTN